MAPKIVPVRIGDVVRLKKPHPCGANEWEIDRVGADIGLRCHGCDRRVMLPRSEFDRRFRGYITRAAEVDDTAGDDGAPACGASSEDAENESAR